MQRTRIWRALIMFLGLVAAIAGTMMGCGNMFAWNGRHAIDLVTLPASGPFTHSLTPEPGRRYTVALQVVFDRADLPSNEGSLVVEARMSLVAKITDVKANELSTAIGWFDPNEPPTKLIGQAANARRDTELVAERFLGPINATSREPLKIMVDLGEDQRKTAVIVARRIVIYDDALPPSITRAFMVAGAGVLVFSTGVALFVASFFRARKKKKAPSKAG